MPEYKGLEIVTAARLPEWYNRIRCYSQVHEHSINLLNGDVYGNYLRSPYDSYSDRHEAWLLEQAEREDREISSGIVYEIQERVDVSGVAWNGLNKERGGIIWCLDYARFGLADTLKMTRRGETTIDYRASRYVRHSSNLDHVGQITLGADENILEAIYREVVPYFIDTLKRRLQDYAVATNELQQLLQEFQEE